MSNSIGNLTADLIARTKAFEAGMKRGQKELRDLRKSAKKTQTQVRALSLSMRRMAGVAAGLVGAAGFTGLIRSSIAFGSAQSDIAGQLKINTRAFQVYSGAIRDAGGSQEQMRKAILSQTQAIVQGSEGLTTYTRAFERLGLNVKTLRGLKPEKQFQIIANAVANAADKQAALTAVTEIYGKRQAPELIELMERLARDGFGKVAEEVERTYGIMDAETQRRLDMASDRIEQFKQRATIKVGDLIAGEANLAAIKELGLRLVGMAARFGGRIVDAFLQTGRMANIAFSATADMIADRIKTAFGDALDFITLKASETLLNIRKFNPFMGHEEWLEALNNHTKIEQGILMRRAQQNEKERTTWEQFFNQRMDEFVETDVANSLGSFWDNLADEQRKILEKSRAIAAQASGPLSTGKIPALPSSAPPSSVPPSRSGGSAATLSSSQEAPLEGEALRKAASKQKKGFRFQRMADGNFQRFVNGSQAGTFTEGELQKGLNQNAGMSTNLNEAGANKKQPQKESDSVGLGEKLDQIINILKPLSSMGS